MKLTPARYGIIGLFFVYLIYKLIQARQPGFDNWMAQFISNCSTPDFICIVFILVFSFFWVARKQR